MYHIYYIYVCILQTSPQTIPGCKGNCYRQCGNVLYGMFVCLLDYCLFCRYANGVGVCVCEYQCLPMQVLVSLDIFATPLGISVDFHFIVALCQLCGDGCNLCFTSGYGGNYCWYCCCLCCCYCCMEWQFFACIEYATLGCCCCMLLFACCSSVTNNNGSKQIRLKRCSNL